MKRIASMIVGLVLAAGLASCGETAPTAELDATTSMDNMEMPAESRSAAGTGTISAIDPATGQVSIDHGEIAALEWPPMDMGFEAAPGALEGLNVGDRVDFEFDWDGTKGTVTKIARAQP